MKNPFRRHKKDENKLTIKVDVDTDEVEKKLDAVEKKISKVGKMVKDHNCADHCGHISHEYERDEDELDSVATSTDVIIEKYGKKGDRVIIDDIIVEDRDAHLRIDYEDDGFAFAKFMKEVLKIKKWQALADKYGVTFTFAEGIE